MKVKLNRPLTLGGQTHLKGAIVDVPPAAGKALVRLGRVTPIEDVPAEASNDQASLDQSKEVQVGTTLKDLGGGWYELSNGEKVQGKEAAQEAEKALASPTINQ